jgi:hypothetical protein
MPDELIYHDHAAAGLDEIKAMGPDLKTAIDMGKEQASTRDRAIDVIDQLCDTLQLAADIVSAEISSAISEFRRAKDDDEQILRGYFERLALRFAEPTLRLRLHEGHVCGELHKLGDRFATPFSPESVSALSIWEAVKAFFGRSTAMSRALDDLVEGERHYLRDYADLLNDVRDQAEAVWQIPLGDGSDQLREAGERLAQLMRQKRDHLQEKVRTLRTHADAAIASLH